MTRTIEEIKLALRLYLGPVEGYSHCGDAESIHQQILKYLDIDFTPIDLPPLTIGIIS